MIRGPALHPVALVLVIALAGGPAACAGGSSTIRPVRERTLELPGGEIPLAVRDDFRGERDRVAAGIERVREGVAVAYRDLGFGVDPKASNASQVATPFLRIQGQLYDGEPNSRYLSCGATAAGRPAADVHDDLRFRMVTLVTPAGGEATDIETRIEGEARPRGGTRAPVSCTGTGVLEHRVNVRAVQAVAAGTPG
ncbi:MAG: hypothetical protein P8177_00705 [Gemmatimonadota bacterium]|jgi:hypothetical protein